MSRSVSRCQNFNVDFHLSKKVVLYYSWYFFVNLIQPRVSWSYICCRKKWIKKSWKRIVERSGSHNNLALFFKFPALGKVKAMSRSVSGRQNFNVDIDFGLKKFWLDYFSEIFFVNLSQPWASWSYCWAVRKFSAILLHLTFGGYFCISIDKTSKKI